MKTSDENLRLLDGFINYTGEGRKTYQRVFKFVQRQMNNHDDSEDVILDVQLKAFLDRDRYKPDIDLLPWLYTIAKHSIGDQKRNNRRWEEKIGLRVKQLREKLKEREKTPLEEAALEEEKKQVRDYVRKLTYYQQQAIDMYFYQGLEQKKAAEQLGIPEDTFKSRIHMGLERLRSYYSLGLPETVSNRGRPVKIIPSCDKEIVRDAYMRFGLCAEKLKVIIAKHYGIKLTEYTVHKILLELGLAKRRRMGNKKQDRVLTYLEESLEVCVAASA